MARAKPLETEGISTPCDTIQKSQIDFLATSTDLHLLAEGLRSLGFTVNETETGLSFAKYGTTGTYDKASGRLASQGFQDLDTLAVKRAYSKEIVNSQAKKFGWRINWKTNDQGQEEATVEKRA